jgi:uncharacterized protein involved in exopolysaccharide biosynthesis
MPNPRLTGGSDPDEHRLELTSAEGRQFLALYSERLQTVAAPESRADRIFQLLPAIAWRWRRSIAMGALAGAVLGFAYLAIADPVYVVRALVQIEKRDSVLQQYETVRSGSTFIATQSEVIRSLVGDAIDTRGVLERPTPGLLTKARHWAHSRVPIVPDAEPSDPRNVAVLSALAALGATPMVGTDVMAITFRTADPQEGVAFLDALIARYREYMRNLETEAHGEGLELLRRQDDELRIELEELQARYTEQHADVMALGRDENVFSIQKVRLEEHAKAHVGAQGRRIELENRLAQYAKNGADLQSPQDQLVEELRLAEAAMAEVRATADDAHPDVRQMKYQLELLREQLARNSVAQLAVLKSDVRAARRTEQMLSGLYVEEWATAKELEIRRENEEQIRKTIERVELKRNAVGALLGDKELQVLSMQSGRSGTVIRTLNPPQVPMHKVWPSPGIVLTAFGSVGILAAFGVAFFSELRTRTDADAVWCS